MWIVILALPLFLAGCSGSGGGDAPPVLTPTSTQQSPNAPPVVSPVVPPAPAPAGIIWRRDNTLMRSQTDGSGQVTLVDTPGFDPYSIFLSGSTVVYHITAPPLPPMANFGLTDIWQVQTNGTANHSVVATSDAEIIRDVFGPWVIYEHAVYAQGTFASSTIRNARLDGPGQALVTDARAIYRLHLGDRAVFERLAPLEDDGVQDYDGNMFSILPDGIDLRPLTAFPSGRNGTSTFITAMATLGNQVLFGVASYPQSIVNLYAVAVAGGPVTTLTVGSDYTWIAAVVGERIVYQRCVILPPDPEGPRVGPCDIYSVLSDGTGTVALATHQDMEFFQGAIGSQLIFRRNGGGATDTLYSVPAAGGAETFLLNLSAQNEFVSWIVEDRIILKRPTGLWSLKIDGGSLVQLTGDASDSTNREAGPFICFARGLSAPPDLWCVPVDGSGVATQVATGAYFVTGL